MNWLAFHTQAEAEADLAEQASRQLDFSKAKKLYRSAAELEERAYRAVEQGKPRTSSILGLSAVALYFRAEEAVELERLGLELLTRGDILQFATLQTKEMLQKTWSMQQVNNAGIHLLPGQLTVSIEGGNVSIGAAPLDLVLDKIQTIKSMLFRTIEMLQKKPLRRRGLPSRELQDAFRPWLFQAPPGSYRFSIGIEKPAQMDLFPLPVDPETVAMRFFEVVESTFSEDESRIAQSIPEEEYRMAFLKMARNLTPTGSQFESLSLQTDSMASPVVITAPKRATLTRKLEKSRQSEISDTGPQHALLKGVLRALELDKDWVKVAVDGEEHLIFGVSEQLDDVIGNMVNKPVIAKVSQHRGKMRLVDIDLAE
ncbi:hypothetical protein [Salinarimonas sp.]|uniref:hypothetical protein n=1 Tax=Salinarimonas sp. TaxID=2766526 RepID=UPI00391AF51D